MVADTHAKALQELVNDVTVKGVFSRSPTSRSEFAQRFGWEPVPSFDALIDDESIDALIILTPPDARMPIVEAAASAGKHLLVEKPLERTFDAADRIVETCARNKVTLAVTFQNRFRPAAMALKRLLQSEAMGRLASIEIAVPWWRPQSYYDEPGRGTFARDGGGVLITQAIHTLDLVCWLIGGARSVQAAVGTTLLHRMEAEDFVVAGIEFAEGVLGALFATTASYAGAPEFIKLNCTDASATLRGGMLKVDWHDGRTEQFGEQGNTGAGANPMAFGHQLHRHLIKDFVDALAKGREPMVPGHQALQVHKLIDALQESGRQQRRIYI